MYYYKLNDDGSFERTDDDIGMRNGIKNLWREEFDNHIVSTIFLGLDHSFGSEKPILFETMVFSENIDYDQYQIRYLSYEEAKQGHINIYNKIKAGKSLTRKTLKLNFKCEGL